MTRFNFSTLLLAATASLALAGCASGDASSRTASASEASSALAKGKTGKAIALAEKAALATPADPAIRAQLGSSYLAAGRFQSACEAFEDALVLGDVSPNTALGFVLSSIAVGDNQSAIRTLNEWGNAMSASDLGLAYALAGNPEMGAQVLTNALRGGDNTPVLRQNLAYANALAGQWATARIIAAEDVAPDKLDQRISEWARMARAEDHTARVAALLGVEAQADAGMPAHLALDAGTATGEAMAAAPAPEAAAAVASGELPPVDLLAASSAAPVRKPLGELKPLGEPVGSRASTQAPASDFASAFVPNRGAGASRVVSNPVVQPAPAPAVSAVASVAVSKPAPKPAAPRSASSRDLADGSHLAQLGSYASEADAKRGWAIFSKRYPEISDREQVITRAKVNGRIYYRLSAGNLAASSARSLCASVKARGHGCIAWEESRPLPGTLDTGRRVATR